MTTERLVCEKLTKIMLIVGSKFAHKDNLEFEITSTADLLATLEYNNIARSASDALYKLNDFIKSVKKGEIIDSVLSKCMTAIMAFELVKLKVHSSISESDMIYKISYFSYYVIKDLRDGLETAFKLSNKV